MSLAPLLWAGLAGAAALPAAREALRRPMDEAARADAPGGLAALSQGSTHYQWLGRNTGPVAVCIHGLTTPSFVWHGLAPILTEMGFRVLVYDLYGRGYSDRPRGAQTPAFFVRQLHDLLVHLKLHDDLTLIGYSMGGVIAAAYAAHYPHQMRRAILVAPAGFDLHLGRLSDVAARWPVVGDWLFPLAYPRQMRTLWAEESAKPSSVPDLAERMEQQLRLRGCLPAVLSSLRYTLRAPVPGIHRQLAAAQVPVGAIWGEDDTAVPISGMGLLAQWNRDARQAQVAGAGHGLLYTHTPQVADAIREVAGLI